MCARGGPALLPRRWHVSKPGRAAHAFPPGSPRRRTGERAGRGGGRGAGEMAEPLEPCRRWDGRGGELEAPAEPETTEQEPRNTRTPTHERVRAKSNPPLARQERFTGEPPPPFPTPSAVLLTCRRAGGRALPPPSPRLPPPQPAATPEGNEWEARGGSSSEQHHEHVRHCWRGGHTRTRAPAALHTRPGAP